MIGDPTYAATHRRTEDGKEVFQIGRYEVTVDPTETDPDKAVRYAIPRGRYPETGPHIEIQDGQVVIDLHELLEMSLLRTPPLETAEALWRNADVRAAFCELFVGHPHGQGDSDWDDLRRDTLTKANENLLETRLNKAANTLRSAEYYERKYWEDYHGRNYMAGRAERPDFLPGFQENEGDRQMGGKGFYVREDPEFAIGSRNWDEARDWWRARLVEMLATDSPDTADKPDNVRGVRSTELAGEA